MTLSFNKNYITVFGVITCAIFVLIGYQNGIFSSPESLKVFLSDLGIFAPLGFILFQIIQCVIPIIPGGFGCVIGVAVFGPVYGFIYNYISICMGSIINFLLVRKYGKNLVLKLISQKNYDKYISRIEKGNKFDMFFALAMLAPCAPDDLLCFLAGMTPMTLKKFVYIIFICKPWSIVAYSMTMNIALTWICSLF